MPSARSSPLGSPAESTMPTGTRMATPLSVHDPADSASELPVIVSVEEDHAGYQDRRLGRLGGRVPSACRGGRRGVARQVGAVDLRRVPDDQGCDVVEDGLHLTLTVFSICSLVSRTGGHDISWPPALRRSVATVSMTSAALPCQVVLRGRSSDFQVRSLGTPVPNERTPHAGNQQWPRRWRPRTSGWPLHQLVPRSRTAA